ncbi:MAG: phosphoribosylglycinamide formyltransferase [Bacteroidetes bacterium]|nr:phosphoribosylglycinamide formyltransferase [Bacteroidota bacterium]MBL6944839.1 phosphoribosylglycinamide formyltransferase [Bacteroidales bacterium]
MKNIAVFASGNGTNAERIIKYFEKSSIVQVNIVLTNNSNAGVIKRAQSLFVDAHVFNRNDFYNSDKILDILKQKNIDLIVLAGFLWLVPESLIEKYQNRIINIHPALLPDYGGKGMYGQRVHEAVIEAGEPKSGITIHYVNKIYDNGQIIFQAKVNIEKNDTPQSLAEKIHLLEYKHFPEVIESILF